MLGFDPVQALGEIVNDVLLRVRLAHDIIEPCFEADYVSCEVPNASL